MMSSTQIAQMNHHAFSMGYGANPGLNSHESISGITPFGHGAGTQAGVGLVGGMASTANTLSMAGLGALGGRFLLNKLGVGAGLARGLGTFATLTGATLPMAASLGLVMPGLAALGGMASGANQYARTQGTLDRAFGNRLGMGGAFGYGVGREEARQLTEAMRSMKAIPEMMTSMGELQDILDTVSNMGILKGVRDAAEFKNKFTSMVHALRDMSRDLGTTMKEATALFSASVGQGFLDMDQAMVNARMAKSGSAVGIGMDTNRMMGLQSGGAAFLRSIGADSRAGAFGARDFATSVSVAQAQGIISAQDILTITGKTGEEGVADLSQSLMRAQVNLFQNTGAGRFLTAALAKRDQRGMFTGALDQDILKRLRSGQISGKELMRLGETALSGLNDEQALSFTNAMERGMGASAGALAGSGGSATALSAILDEMGADNDEAARVLVRRLTGASQRQADMMLDLARNASRINQVKNDEMLQAAVRDRSVSFFKESMLTGQLHHMSTGLQKTFVDPFQRAGSNMATRVSRVFDEITDDFVGGTTADRVRMLTFGMPREIGRLLFSDPSRRRLNASQITRGTNNFLTGGASNMFSDRQDAEMGDLLDAAIASQQESKRGGLSGIAGGALVGAGMGTLGYLALGAFGAATGGLGLLALGGAAAIGAGVGGGFQIGREGAHLTMAGAHRRKLLERALGKTSGQKLGSFRQIMSKEYGDEQRKAALDRLKKLISERGMTADDIRGMGAEALSELIGDLGSGGLSGMETLSAAAGYSGGTGDDQSTATQAAKIAESFRAVIASGAMVDSAGAENEINAAFSGGITTLFNDNASTGGLNGAYFISETAKSIALSGDPKKRKALLRLLEDKSVAQMVVRNKDNPEQLEKISRDIFNGAISKEELRMIAEDMADSASGGGGVEYDSFKAVADRIRDPSNRMVLDANQMTAQAGVDAIRENYGTEGQSIANSITTGGLYRNIGNIAQMIQRSTGGSARLNRLKEALKTNRFKSSSMTEAAMQKAFEQMGVTQKKLEDAGIKFDGTFTSEERETASQLMAIHTDLSSIIKSKSSPEMQRAERLGLTPELQLKIADQYEKAIAASEKTLRVHTDAIVQVTDAVARLQTNQNIGTEIV